MGDEQAREFQFVGGTSRKFWRIHRDGASVVVTFGRIGSTGQTKTKAHPDAATAEREAAKLVAAKLAEGYVEGSWHEPSGAPPAAPAPTWEELAAKVNRPPRPASDAELQAVAQALGLPQLPPSYCQYQRLLSGKEEWRRVSRRKGLPFFLCVLEFDKLVEQRAYVRTVLVVPEEGSDDERAASAAAQRLIPFGNDSSRINYCWDPADRGPDGELGIVAMDNDTWMPKVTRIAGDLLELLALYRPSTEDDE
jgi:predicted DNA-binding WGR domain protein